METNLLIFRVLFFLACCGCRSANCCASEPNSCVEFMVKIEARLLPEGRRGDTKLVPCPHAVICLERFALSGSNSATKLAVWVRENAAIEDSRLIKFRVVDDYVLPKVVLAGVGDRILLMDDTHAYSMNFFSNLPSGSILRGDSEYKISKPEPFETLVEAIPETKGLAAILVSDHRFAAISNENGITRFEKFPRGLEVPLRVIYPFRKERVIAESPTLGVDPKSTRIFVLVQGPEERHEIILRPISEN